MYRSMCCYPARGGGGALTYESDVRVPPSTSDVGVFWWQIGSKKGVFQWQAHKNRGSFSEMHEKNRGFQSKNCQKFLNFRQICQKSHFPLIVTCLTIQFENEWSLSDKDVSGSFGGKEFVKNRGSLGESW